MELSAPRAGSCSRRFRWAATLEKLVFICPKTDQQVDIGLASEIGTLLRIRSRLVRAQCPACGETHEWLVRDAALVRAA